MEEKISELKAFIHDLWVKSCYSFDEQAAQKKLITIIEESPNEYKIVTLRNLLVYVTDYFRQDLFNIHLHSKKREYVQVKQIYCYMARQLFPGISLATIGKEIREDYDHATVLHSVRTIENELNTNKFLEKDVNKLFDKLNMDTDNDKREKVM